MWKSAKPPSDHLFLDRAAWLGVPGGFYFFSPDHRIMDRIRARDYDGVRTKESRHTVTRHSGKSLAAISGSSCVNATCTLLAVVLMLGSVQPLLGVILYQQDSQPAFTLNICHPLQSLNESPNVSLTPPASTGQIVFVSFERIFESIFLSVIEFISDIDPPPPKLAA